LALGLLSKDEGVHGTTPGHVNFSSNLQPSVGHGLECDIHDRSLPLPVQGSSPTCGKILQHATKQVELFRKTMGSNICVFKVGVTSDPAVRFLDYRAKNFTSMWIVHTSNDLGLIHMLEASLVLQFHHCVGCRNAPNTGGEGGMSRMAPPYYVYVTGGRADQFKRVG